MMKRISGIHHITSIVGDAQENVNFYRDVLGLRLIKKTVNFDDPRVYHLYFGDKNYLPIDDISPDVAIKGFAGAVFYSHFPEITAEIMEDFLGFEKLGEEGEYIRFKSFADIGNTIDIKTTSSGRGITSLGTVHHIAWRAEDEEDLLEWQSLARERKFAVGDVRDRKYFKSIY
ncbi:MAG: hypothetical protein GX021_04105 [Tissierellia bacterium]|nr:hypothetical protein [Tissierellia bacterium]